MTPDQLIEELCSAPVGSRKLSDKFLLAMGWRCEPAYIRRVKVSKWYNAAGKRVACRNDRPSPTEDMQDTLEAVPEGWELQINISKKGSVVCMCPDWSDDYAPVFWSNEPDESERGKHYKRRIGRHATPQLALSAAILKAKGAQDGSR